MANPVEIAKQFVDFYYQTFDSNRAGLQGLYVSASATPPSNCIAYTERVMTAFLATW